MALENSAAFGIYLLRRSVVGSRGIGVTPISQNQRWRLPLLSWLLFWPFHGLNFGILALVRRRALRDGTLFSNIEDNVWLGARLSNQQAMAWASGNFSVLDVAGELSENAVFRSAVHYLSLPTLDRYPPSSEALRRGAHWIIDRQTEGPVYVHCALGHGRSATFICAYLLLNGRASNADEAVALVKMQRPSIDLSDSQLKVLRQLQ